jgi:hypothetical protein
MQNMMLRMRKVKNQSHQSMKRFFVFKTDSYPSQNRDVLAFAPHSGDHATTHRSGSVNQIGTNVDENLPPVCGPFQARGSLIGDRSR